MKMMVMSSINGLQISVNCGMYIGVKMVVFSFRFSNSEIKGVMSRWLQHP